MKRYLLALICLNCLVSLVYAQEETRIEEKDTLSSLESEVGLIPESLDANVDSLLRTWHVQYFSKREDFCHDDDENVYFPDSVYIDRLSRLPSVIALPYNNIVRDCIDLYAERKRNLVRYMLGMADFYFPIIEQVLDEHGLPIELKYLAVVESALNPVALSRVGACGLWQFMLPTGKSYGLEINSLVDERRDPLKATEAACKYFKDMYAIYGDWNLVLASYNCGPGNVNKAAKGDLSSATATAAIARTKDLKNWERLPDLRTKSQQRNVVLHPEFVNGMYALYTRPQDGFIDAGSGGGIGWALVEDITHAEVKNEKIIDKRYYHTIKEVKNGEGPHPLKTSSGWLHLAHGVRGCASGLRYVLYMYMTSLEDPTKIIAAPAGYFMAPVGEERVGDVSNVLFSNGWIVDEDGTVFIYYASSDTRMHVATSTIDRLVDYCMNTPQDGFSSYASVLTLKEMIDKNLAIIR